MSETVPHWIERADGPDDENALFAFGGIYDTDAASGTADVQYYFNGAARMTKLTDWTGDLEYRYSNIGQLTKLIDYDDAELTYAYDPVGRVTSMTDYHSATTSYEYDDGGRLTTLIAPGSKEREFVYNPPSADFQHLGQPIETYNPYGSASKSAKSTLFQCNLPNGGGDNKLNPYGRSQMRRRRMETFGYDNRNRLTRRYLGTQATGGTDLGAVPLQTGRRGHSLAYSQRKVHV